MNQIRNCVSFSCFLRCIPHSQRSRHFQKLRAFSIRIFFHFSLSLRALSLQKEPTGENSAIFEQFFSPPLRPLWKKERAFPLPIVPRAIIAFFTGIPSRSFCRGERNNFSFSAKSSLCIVFDQVLH